MTCRQGGLANISCWGVAAQTARHQACGLGGIAAGRADCCQVRRIKGGTDSQPWCRCMPCMRCTALMALEALLQHKLALLDLLLLCPLLLQCGSRECKSCCRVWCLPSGEVHQSKSRIASQGLLPECNAWLYRACCPPTGHAACHPFTTHHRSHAAHSMCAAVWQASQSCACHCSVSTC